MVALSSFCFTQRIYRSFATHHACFVVQTPSSVPNFTMLSHQLRDVIS